mgnify:FL=1
MNGEQRGRSLRELARRLLRSRGVIVRLPLNFQLEDSDLAVRIGDVAPSIYFGVEFTRGTTGRIEIELMGEEGGLLSSEIPDDELRVWVPGDMNANWTSLIEHVLVLAEAGYPGCVGCAGPEAEIDWDEAAARRALLT